MSLRIRSNFQTDIPTANNRIYPRNVFIEALDRARQRRLRDFFTELDVVNTYYLRSGPVSLRYNYKDLTNFVREIGQLEFDFCIEESKKDEERC